MVKEPYHIMTCVSSAASVTTSSSVDIAANEQNTNADARASAALDVSLISTSALSSEPLSTSKTSSTVTSPSYLMIYQLTQDEIDFIARTENSSWRAQREPAKAYEAMAELGMEPRLYRRPVSTDGSRSRPPVDSTRMGRRAVSWATRGHSLGTSMDSQYLLNAGPKKISLSLRAELPNQSFHAYRNDTGMGNGKGDGQKKASLLTPQRLSNSASPGRPLKDYPTDAFRNLPKEIMLLIIAELRLLHLDGEEKRKTCPSCYLRDLCSLALSCRQVNGAAREKLYETIMLVGLDSISHVKKQFKMKYGTRLKLLLRTLWANPDLSKMVKTLRVPTPTEAGVPASKKDIMPYEDIIASVILACPNLERLVGLYSNYDYEFSRIAEALSTRTKLTEHLWCISGKATAASNSARPAVPVEQAFSQQARTFISHHSGWGSLGTLAIHCTPTSTFDASMLSPLLSLLPSLRHLALSSVPLPSDFVLSLPPLSSLHLSTIPTATPQTLVDLTRAPLSLTLSSLTLALLPPDVISLPSLARILSSMPSLSRLSISSPTALALPIGISIFLHPYFASSSVGFLHWDVPSSPLASFSKRDHNDASYLLAKAIAADGFPKLRRLRAQRDMDGILQRVCRPSRGFDVPLTPNAQTGSAALANGNGSALKNGPRRRKDSVSSVSSGASGGGAASGDLPSRPSARLREARVAAQARIELARLKPRWRIVCEDWSRKGRVKVTSRFDVGGFMGTVGSRVEYWLEDDEMRGFESLLGEGGRGEECNGSWNARTGEKRGWRGGGVRSEWHTPRERGWRNESLEGLF